MKAMKALKPCTKEEIEAFQKFAALSLEERRRQVYMRYVVSFPNTDLTRDILSGKFKLPKKRGRKKQQLGFKLQGRKPFQQRFKQFELWRD